MRAIESAICLSKVLAKKLQIYWIKDDKLNCSFHELFQSFPPSIASIVDMEARPIYLNDYRWKSKLKYVVFAPLQYFLFGKTMFLGESTALVNAEYNFEALRRYDRFLIESYSRFYDDGIRPAYGHFRPIDAIESEIKRITRDFPEEVIGVHIRRSDNKKAAMFSPTEAFVHAMAREIKDNPAVRFFVASDDEKVKVKLMSIFGERIILRSLSSANRDTETGMVDALVDLYALSKTNKILGSYWSSFSHTAADISNIKEITVRPGKAAYSSG